MPCKVQNHQYRETCVESDNRKSQHACIVEAHESARKRLESTLPEDHEDHIAERVQFMKSLQSCAQVSSKEKSKKEGYSGTTKRAKNSPFCHTDGHTSPQKFGVRTKITKVQRQSRAMQFLLNRGRLRPR